MRCTTRDLHEVKETPPRIWRSNPSYKRVIPLRSKHVNASYRSVSLHLNFGSLPAMYLPLQEPFLDELFRTVDSHSYSQVRFLPCSCSWSLINSVLACVRIRLRTQATGHFHMDTNHRSKIFHVMQARHLRKRSPRLYRRLVITRCPSISLPRRWWIHPSRHPSPRPLHKISRGARPRPRPRLHHIHIHPHIHPRPRP